MASERDDLTMAAWSALKGAAWTMFSRLAKEKERAPVPPAQAAFLCVLTWAGQPLTPQDIARRIEVTPATVTGMLNTLEESGLVQRLRQSEDRRVVHVHLTAAGQAVARSWTTRFRAHLEEAMAPLSDAELRTLTTLLTKVGPPMHGPFGGFASLIRHDPSAAPARPRRAKPAAARARRAPKRAR